MLKSIKYIITIILLSVVIFTLSTCKKYPENTVWFKNKNKIFIMTPNKKRLTAFIVNGLDSLDELNKYFNWNATDKNIKNVSFEEIDYKNLKNSRDIKLTILSNYVGDFRYAASYNFNRKKISFDNYRFALDTSKPFKKDIFLGTDAWDIIKLIPNKLSKLRKKINGNTYEIQFENYD